MAYVVELRHPKGRPDAVLVGPDGTQEILQRAHAILAVQGITALTLVLAGDNGQGMTLEDAMAGAKDAPLLFLDGDGMDAIATAHGDAAAVKVEGDWKGQAGMLAAAAAKRVLRGMK